MEDKWFEKWFDTPYYHALYKNRDYLEAEKFISNLIKYLNPNEKSQFLDIACGKGRHSIFIHKKGYSTTGYDLSEQSILEAKKSEEKGLNFFTHDMRKIFRTNYYNFALNLFTSFGYFQNSRDELNAIRSATLALKDGGTFVIDFLNHEKVKSELIPEETKIIDNIIFNIKKYIKDQKVHKEISFEADGQSHTYTEKVKLLGLSDFKHYFTQSGLEIVDVFGDYDLSSHHASSNRLIIIGKKNG